MLSVTAITSYMYCPRKLYLTRILKLSEPPKAVMTMGSLRHEIYDQVNKAEKQLIIAINAYDPNRITETYKQKYADITRSVLINFKPQLQEVQIPLIDAFKDVWPFFEQEYKFRATNLQHFMQTSNLTGIALWENLTPKIESEISVSSTILNLKGIVDRIELHEKEIIPTEVKTGKAPTDTVWEPHKIQLAAYIMLLEEKYQRPITRGYIHYILENKKIEIIINPFLKDEVKELTRKTEELLNCKELPPIIKSESKCNICGLKDECYKLDKL